MKTNENSGAQIDTITLTEDGIIGIKLGNKTLRISAVALELFLNIIDGNSFDYLINLFKDNLIEIGTFNVLLRKENENLAELFNVDPCFLFELKQFIDFFNELKLHNKPRGVE